MNDHRRIRRCATIVACTLAALLVAGCKYVTPARGANMASIAGDPASSLAGVDMVPRYEVQPEAHFPTAIAVARIQAPGYSSYSARSVGHGRYSVVTVRDIETDADFERLMALPEVVGVAAINRMLIPQDLRSDRDLRKAAADLHADVLLLYTFDTVFRVASKAEPLGVVTLGLFPSKQARVTSTASALILDSRTGYIYATAEATSQEQQLANAWTSSDAVDQSRRRAERSAFEQLLERIEGAWPEIVSGYAHAPQPTAEPVPSESARAAARP